MQEKVPYSLRYVCMPPRKLSLIEVGALHQWCDQNKRVLLIQSYRLLLAGSGRLPTFAPGRLLSVVTGRSRRKEAVSHPRSSNMKLKEHCDAGSRNTPGRPYQVSACIIGFWCCKNGQMRPVREGEKCSSQIAGPTSRPLITWPASFCVVSFFSKKRADNAFCRHVGRKTS